MLPIANRIIVSLFSILSLLGVRFVLRRGSWERRLPARAESILQGIGRGPIAHRGGVPENTIAGFRISKEHGASSVEVDLHHTRDGHPVLIHDYSVDRTSNGRGNVADLTLQQIKELDVGTKFGHSGATVPSLYEALDAINELDMFMFLELKSADAQTLSTIKEIFSKDRSLYTRVCVISFFPDVIAKLKYNDPDIMVGLVMRSTIFSHTPDGIPRFPQSWKVNLARAAQWLMYGFLTSIVHVIGVDMILPHKGDILSGRFQLEKYKRNGVAIVTWTVNDNGEKEQFQEILKIPYMTDNVKK